MKAGKRNTFQVLPGYFFSSNLTPGPSPTGRGEIIQYFKKKQSRKLVEAETYLPVR